VRQPEQRAPVSRQEQRVWRSRRRIRRVRIAYLDDSAKEPDQGPGFVLAGWVATASVWTNFEVAWKAALKKHGAPPFHHTDLRARKRGFESFDDDGEFQEASPLRHRVNDLRGRMFCIPAGIMAGHALGTGLNEQNMVTHPLFLPSSVLHIRSDHASRKRKVSFQETNTISSREQWTGRAVVKGCEVFNAPTKGPERLFDHSGKVYQKQDWRAFEIPRPEDMREIKVAVKKPAYMHESHNSGQLINECNSMSKANGGLARLDNTFDSFFERQPRDFFRYKETAAFENADVDGRRMGPGNYAPSMS